MLVSTNRHFLPNDVAIGLAISIPDITLDGPAGQIELSALICHSGTYLCDGQDQEFRRILADIVARPSISCQ